MKTAVVSDLHLGANIGCDLCRDPDVRRKLFSEIEGADRLVLLGDALELRDGPVGEILAVAEPFFAELGELMNGREVILVPGNHDHRLAEPLLERRSLRAPRIGTEPDLGLEQRLKPSAGAGAKLARMLGPGVRMEIAYPGIWLRDDVWATHGHYLDCHMPLPTIECLAAATSMRFVGEPGDPATVAEYERAVGPAYGFTYAFAQSRGPARVRGAAKPTNAAWEMIAYPTGIRHKLVGKVGFPAATWLAGRLTGRRFQTEVSAKAVSRAGWDSMRETIRRLQVPAEHVIFGHTHRSGPRPERDNGINPPGAPQLHNTGSWVYSPGLLGPTPEKSLHWPGTMIWLEDEGPPRIVRLLDDVGASGLESARQRIAEAQQPD